jgi:hypothetical protein
MTLTHMRRLTFISQSDVARDGSTIEAEGSRGRAGTEATNASNRSNNADGERTSGDFRSPRRAATTMSEFSPAGINRRGTNLSQLGERGLPRRSTLRRRGTGIFPAESIAARSNAQFTLAGPIEETPKLREAHEPYVYVKLTFTTLRSCINSNH